MEKWKNALRLVLSCLVLVTFTPSTSYSQNYCNPCYDPCSFGGFEFGVDFIWWKPCVDSLEYADTSSNLIGIDSVLVNADFKYKKISPKWEPGFRLHLAKSDLWCKWEVIASYTFLKPDNSSSGSVFTNTLLHPELDRNLIYTHASGKWDTTYQSWDVLVGFPITVDNCQIITPQFGVAGLFLDQKIQSKATRPEVTEDTFGKVKWDSDYWGVGLKLGTLYEIPVCGNYKLFADLSGTLVAGDYDNKNTQVTSVGATPDITTIEFEDKGDCHLIPGYHILVGTEYSTCWCDRYVDVHLGYEFVQWHNVPNPRRFFIPNNQGPIECVRSTSNNTSTLGFHGLFAGVNMRF